VCIKAEFEFCWNCPYKNGKTGTTNTNISNIYNTYNPYSPTQTTGLRPIIKDFEILNPTPANQYLQPPSNRKWLLQGAIFQHTNGAIDSFVLINQDGTYSQDGRAFNIYFSQTSPAADPTATIQVDLGKIMTPVVIYPTDAIGYASNNAADLMQCRVVEIDF
jgi:hypothetical protein